MLYTIPYRKIKTVQQLKSHKTLYKRVLRIAQFESEVDMGVNPKNFDQADVSALTASDFGYIAKVCALVEKRLNNPNWIVDTIHEIENKFKTKPERTRGIKFNDELFKANRGILESHLQEMDNH